MFHLILFLFPLALGLGFAFLVAAIVTGIVNLVSKKMAKRGSCEVPNLPNDDS